MSKKLLAILLSLVMVFAFAACGEEANKGDKDETKAPVSQDGSGILPADGLIIANDDSEDLETPSKTLDPSVVYSQLTYTPQMFNGSYRILGGDDAEMEYAESADYVVTTKDETKFVMADMPLKIECGKDTLNHVINSITEYDWMRVTVAYKTNTSGDIYTTTIFAAYSIEGNTLTLKPLDNYVYDSDTEEITSYTFTGMEFEYEFEFRGLELTLKSGDKTVTMYTGLDYSEDELYIYLPQAYLEEGSKAVGTIDNFSFSYSDDYCRNDFCGLDGYFNYRATVKLENNGLMTVTVPWVEGTATYQCVYFYLGYDGMILTDGENVHYYTESYSERSKRVVDGLLDGDSVSELTEEELEAIVEKKDDLVEDLVAAFENAKITVSIDKTTGEVAMDTAVLFDGDSAVLKKEGKEFLDKFTAAYTSIVYSDEYSGFISKTMVEGHVAPVAGDSYDDGYPLSEERATNVKDYCVSIDKNLEDVLEVVAYSNSKPVYDKDGNVDMEASRRVSFRFIINLEQ